ncbi:hypothetical protein HNQ07_001928 [Deinococcus metalli]|uniref:Uncharacterized protein n=1 Tax=Deinococcus metalli TaxID=1141878 RepID=A0A7W8KE15_9DEIO|nr:hypothetical protein [Deinococcus metalli]MBB5376464.1 hypothetical protein [Deinococcus metalli]GHF43841.1 hypothetical protein GCM10017781_20370 [Deinococcus metalli]
MSDDKSVGERLGDAVDAVKHKANEGADRARAEEHDYRAETSDNPLERAVEKGKGLVDRGKAEMHEAASERNAKESTR